MTATVDYHILFSDYIAICNRALEKHSDRFPFKHILESVQQREKGDIVDVQITGKNDTPRFRLKIEKNKVTAATCSGKQCYGGCAKRQWQVDASYLQQVIDDAETYINNPALIDWEWMYQKPL